MFEERVQFENWDKGEKYVQCKKRQQSHWKTFQNRLDQKKRRERSNELLGKTIIDFYQKEKELFEKTLREIMEDKEILVFSLTDMLRENVSINQ